MRRIARVMFLLLPAVVASQGVARSAVRRMFVSSSTGTAKLGDWPEAVGVTGTEAGDQICTTLAATATLPGNFVAWLSDDANDAYCRVHGLAGKVASNCGQATLPDSAGPWVRTNGTPFAEGLPAMLPPEGLVYLPPRLDENGDTIHGLAWSGTWSNGTDADGYNCSNWTVDSGLNPDGLTGDTDHVAGTWGVGDLLTCNDPSHLYCFEMGPGDPLPPFSNYGLLAFVTSISGSGKLSTWPGSGGQDGLAGGDAICSSLATSAGIANPLGFRAWLSTGAVDARDRFVHPGPRMRVDRARLAADVADLTDGNIHTAINVTETGEYLPDGTVWTGTDANGVAVPQRCAGWTTNSDASNGAFGEVDTADSDWTYASAQDCDRNAHLYCLQDLPLLFNDGFESQDTSVWSAAVP